MSLRMTQINMIALLVLCAPLRFAARAGELDIGILPPIGQVGPIGKVEPIGKVDDKGGKVSVRPLSDTGYLVCWTWNLAREPKWRCTQQYADLPQARQFSNYQNDRYDLGQSFFLSVFKKDWDDPESRKKIMERIKKEAIPKALERAASREEGSNNQRANLIRRQIRFIRPEWINVKPVLSKDSKEDKLSRAGEVQKSWKVGYDDDAILTTRGKKINLVGTKWGNYAGYRVPVTTYEFVSETRMRVERFSDPPIDRQPPRVENENIRLREGGFSVGDRKYKYEIAPDGKTMKVTTTYRGETIEVWGSPYLKLMDSK